MKRCSKCGTEKPESGFSRNKHGRDGLQSRCKECCAQYKRGYRITHADKISAYGRSYHAKNRDRINAKSTTYRADNLDDIRAKGRQYRASNRAELNAKGRVRMLQQSLDRFKVPRDLYGEVLASQGQKCPICGESYSDVRSPCLDHSHSREARGLPSLRGIICRVCNRARVGAADSYLRKLGILDTDPEALPVLLQRKVAFAENVAKHVVSTWAPGLDSRLENQNEQTTTNPKQEDPAVLAARVQGLRAVAR